MGRTQQWPHRKARTVQSHVLGLWPQPAMRNQGHEQGPGELGSVLAVLLGSDGPESSPGVLQAQGSGIAPG